ncbi:MAG: hypothetical protein K6C95_08940 [Lachnospiraceae bacterium]|nr:hypothetical protein [Lachnospiraceae bacterium]
MKIWGLIPGRIPNRIVLFFYDLLSRHFGRVRRGGEGLPEKKSHNAFAFIEDQRRRTDERFGRSSVSRAGCEVIALYNALGILNGFEMIGFSSLVGIFGKAGMALFGLFGTSPRALYRWLFANGFNAVSSDKTDEFDKIAQESTCAILSYYNDRNDIRKGVHTVCLSRQENAFVAHNLTEDGHQSGPYASVSSMLNALGAASGLYLIGLR